MKSQTTRATNCATPEIAMRFCFEVANMWHELNILDLNGRTAGPRGPEYSVMLAPDNKATVKRGIKTQKLSD